MPRRLVVSLSAVLCALLAVATIALAAGGSSGGSREKGPAAAAPAASSAVASTPAASGARHGARGMRGHHGMFRLLRGMLLKSGADRLGVTPAELQKAVKAVTAAQLEKKAAEAKLTPAEIAALKACRKAHRRSTGKAGCDRAAVRSAITKLKALPRPDLAALKTELSDALGKELGISGAKVLEAARAELVARLDQAVAAKFLDAAGRTKVLACFDAPASCDLKELKRSVLHMKKFGQRRGHGHGQRKGGRRGAALRGAYA